MVLNCWSVMPAYPLAMGTVADGWVWRLADDDYDVLENGVGRPHLLLTRRAAVALGLWAGGHNGDICRAAYGYEASPRCCDGGTRKELSQGRGRHHAS